MDTNLKVPLFISIVIHILVLTFLPAFKKRQIIYVIFPIELVSVPPIEVEEKTIEKEKTKEVVAVKKVVKKKQKPKKKPKPKVEKRPVIKPQSLVLQVHHFL